MADSRSERDQLQQLEKVFAEHDFARALVLTEGLLGDYPASFQGRLYYARVLKELHRLDEAETLLNDLDRQFGGNLNLLVELGDLLFRQKRYTESRAIFERVLFLDSFNRRAKATLAYIEKLLQNPADDRMEDTSVEMRATRREPPPEPIDPNEQTAPEVVLTPTEEVSFVAANQLQFVDSEVNPVAIDLESGRVDFSRQPTLPEDALDEMFGLSAEEKSFARPSLPEDDLGALFSAQAAAASLETQPLDPAALPFSVGAGTVAAEAPVAPDTVSMGPTAAQMAAGAPFAAAPAAPRATAADTAVSPAPPPAKPRPEPPVPANAATGEPTALDFETESAAELYLQQGLYDESEAIFAKLWQRSGRDEYQARVEEVQRLRRTERAMKIIERLLAFLQAAQKRGSSRV